MQSRTETGCATFWTWTGLPRTRLPTYTIFYYFLLILTLCPPPLLGQHQSGTGTQTILYTPYAYSCQQAVELDIPPSQDSDRDIIPAPTPSYRTGLVPEVLCLPYPLLRAWGLTSHPIARYHYNMLFYLP